MGMIQLYQSAFRFYADGTEAGAVASAALNTNHTLQRNTKFHLRVLVAGLDADMTQGYEQFSSRIYFRKNGAGSWLAATAASADIRYDTSSGLVSQYQPSTNRLGDPDYPAPSLSFWSFVAGVAGETGDTESIQLFTSTLTGNEDQFTEFVYALQTMGTANHGDYFDFRVYRTSNGVDETYEPEMNFIETGHPQQLPGYIAGEYHRTPRLTMDVPAVTAHRMMMGF